MKAKPPSTPDPRRYPQPLSDGRVLKPGPLPRENRDEIRDNHIACVISDSDLKGFEAMRKSLGGICKPTRSAFLAHIIHEYVERNRRRDVPCIARKRD